MNHPAIWTIHQYETGMCSLEKLNHSKLFSYEAILLPKNKSEKEGKKKNNPFSASMLDGGQWLMK